MREVRIREKGRAQYDKSELWFVAEGRDINVVGVLHVLGVLRGRARPFRPPESPSGVAKLGQGRRTDRLIDDSTAAQQAVRVHSLVSFSPTFRPFVVPSCLCSASVPFAGLAPSASRTS